MLYRHGKRWQRHQRLSILHHHCHHLVSLYFQRHEHRLIHCSWLDGRHVVFGEVLEGYDVVEVIENTSKRANERPAVDVKIVKSGELEVPEEGIHAEL
jgi:cyclophilin family peptidyl-prolyl cis-trans isomerase